MKKYAGEPLEAYDPIEKIRGKTRETFYE